MTARKLSTVDVKAVHVSEEKPRRVLRTEKHTVLVAPYADGSTAALLRELDARSVPPSPNLPSLADEASSSKTAASKPWVVPSHWKAARAPDAQ